MTPVASKQDAWLDLLQQTNPIRQTGHVEQRIGLVIESQGPAVSIGEICRIEGPEPGQASLLEVVGFKGNRVLLMPLGEIDRVGAGAVVTATGRPLRVPVGEELLGRVLNGLGQPIDGLGPLRTHESRPLSAAPPNPMTRRRIKEPMPTGIRSIDGLVTCGKGQRVGIFAGSGVGKSILLGMTARNCEADLNVIALIGERGREIREFIERDLGPEGLRRSVVVAATSDQTALVRIKSALLATTIAESFRDRGLNVMLVMDSLTRVAMAQREIGLAAGEPPTTKGYPPSVFALLPRLLERAGMSAEGSITGLYTVLVEGDDMNDPVADTSRAILDGHIVLSRRLATENHYPAVDVLESVSRVMVNVVEQEQTEVAAQVREWLAVYREAEDLITIGAYARGNDARVDRAVDKIEAIRRFLKQETGEKSDWTETVAGLQKLIHEGTS